MPVRKSFLSRKRGVSIENVMLGLIVVMIFAGLLYGAFSVVSRKIEAQAVQRNIASLTNEINMLHSQMGSDAFERRYSAGQGRIDFLNYLHDSGAYPVPLISNTTGQNERTLPYDGIVNISSNSQRTQVVMGWDLENTKSIQRLCSAIAGGPALINNAQEYMDYASNPYGSFESMGLGSGPLGQNYFLLMNDCTGEINGYPVLMVVVPHKQNAQ